MSAKKTEPKPKKQLLWPQIGGERKPPKPSLSQLDRERQD